LSDESLGGFDACEKLGEEWISISSLGFFFELDASLLGGAIPLGFCYLLVILLFYLYHQRLGRC
jgi:hypothetical protein